jgi:hypothetical protein
MPSGQASHCLCQSTILIASATAIGDPAMLLDFVKSSEVPVIPSSSVRGESDGEGIGSHLIA